MITRAIERAYSILSERKWDTVYWAVDLHGTVLKSNYEQGGYEFINQAARNALRYISKLPETKIILWSSVHDAEWPAIVEFLNEAGVQVFATNENPDVPNTDTGNFTDKFYFSVLVDDKAGFHPDEWTQVAKTVERLTIQRVRYSA